MLELELFVHPHSVCKCDNLSHYSLYNVVYCYIVKLYIMYCILKVVFIR